MTRPTKAFLLCLALGLVASPAPAQAPEGEGRPADSLKVITYNVQFLPGVARFANRRSRRLYRAGRIGELMAAYDIVGLNETFDEAPRRRITNRLRDAWGASMSVVHGPDPGDWRFDGGLYLASRLPFLETHSHVYRRASRIRDHGLLADGFAAKGVLHARVARSVDRRDDYVDVFVTHLDARQADVRADQIREMAAFVARWSDPDHPTLILGDLNTSGLPDERMSETSNYSRMMEVFRGVRPVGVADLWPTLQGDERGGTTDQTSTDLGGRIDYILHAPGKLRRLAARTIRVRLFQDESVEALSDHSAVESVLDWPED